VLGFELAEIAVLLATFQSPHWTVLFQPPGEAHRPEEELLNNLASGGIWSGSPAESWPD
jgi:hypothetical protein